MKFTITSTSSYWGTAEILEEYPCLKEFDYEADPDNDKHPWLGEGCICVNDLEHLLSLVKDVEQPIIVKNRGDEFAIEIYDGYRE